MLVIDAKLHDEISTHGEEGYPYEICGVLLGRTEPNTANSQCFDRHVLEVHRATNTNKTRANDRYSLDPVDYQAIEDHARKNKLEVLGIYHSHPDHPSRPSETDRARAADVWFDGESWSYVIVEIAKGKAASQRSWILRKEQFDQETIQVVKSDDAHVIDSGSSPFRTAPLASEHQVTPKQVSSTRCM